MNDSPEQDRIDYSRIERAIRYLDEQREAQPTLEDVAAHVGLSKYHFHRLFQRWAGVTPKRFLQYLTVEHARSLLERHEPVLATAYEAGLSGPGRLHDHFVQVEAATPGEVSRGGEGLTIRTGIHPTPFGDALLATTERGVCFLAFVGDDEADAVGELRNRWPRARIVEDPGATATLAREIVQAVEAAVAGDRVRPPTPVTLYLEGTNFQLQVWRALLRVPPGSVTTYGALAEAIGRPEAARAVGSAVGRNPVSFLVPCHRVIRSVGEFGGYRWGRERKRAMLGWEASHSP